MTPTIVRQTGLGFPPLASGAAGQYSAQLVDQNGDNIALSALSALTLSIVNPATGVVVNGVSQTNILNTGRGTVSSTGLVTIIIGGTGNTADTLASASTGRGQTEVRSLILDFTYSGPVSPGRHEYQFGIVQLSGP